MPYKNQEDKRAHDRAWKAERRKDPVYLEALKERSRLSSKKYRMTHPDRAAEWERQGKGRWARAAKSADGSVTSELIDELLSTPICPYCCELMTQDSTTLDHIVPIAKGGTHTADNLAAVCRRCNQAKHASSLLGYMVRLAGPPDAI
jgi:5-methylcytosine-specific restriction endonuclease McrA